MPELCFSVITTLSFAYLVWYFFGRKPKTPRGFEARRIVVRPSNNYESLDVMSSVKRFVMELQNFDLLRQDAEAFWRTLSAQHQQIHAAEIIAAGIGNLPETCQELAKAEASAGVFWTSSAHVSFINERREFCWLVNWAVRNDEVQLLGLLEPFFASLNKYCIPRPVGFTPSPRPPPVLYRGIGVPQDHAHIRAFFTQGKRFRVASFVSSTPLLTVATDFMRTAVGCGRQPLKFVIDLPNGCSHVSSLQLSLHPNEIEWLFTIYAPFMVTDADWKDNPTEANPHTIQLMKLHHLNQGLPPNLELAPWF